MVSKGLRSTYFDFTKELLALAASVGDSKGPDAIDEVGPIYENSHALSVCAKGVLSGMEMMKLTLYICTYVPNT